MPKIIANLNLVCYIEPNGCIGMGYVTNYSEKILPEHKKACSTTFEIIKSSFEDNIISAAELQKAKGFLQ